MTQNHNESAANPPKMWIPSALKDPVLSDIARDAMEEFRKYKTRFHLDPHVEGEIKSKILLLEYCQWELPTSEASAETSTKERLAVFKDAESFIKKFMKADRQEELVEGGKVSLVPKSKMAMLNTLADLREKSVSDQKKDPVWRLVDYLRKNLKGPVLEIDGETILNKNRKSFNYLDAEGMWPSETVFSDLETRRREAEIDTIVLKTMLSGIKQEVERLQSKEAVEQTISEKIESKNMDKGDQCNKASR